MASFHRRDTPNKSSCEFFKKKNHINSVNLLSRNEIIIVIFEKASSKHSLRAPEWHERFPSPEILAERPAAVRLHLSAPGEV